MERHKTDILLQVFSISFLQPACVLQSVEGPCPSQAAQTWVK